MHVGINAQIISLGESYRNAGVSQYTYHLLRYLRPAGSVTELTAFVGASAKPEQIQRETSAQLIITNLPTERPAVRILWEQFLLPIELLRRHVELLHAPVNVLPLAQWQRTVLTIHDLSFVRYPHTFTTSKRHYLSAFTAMSARRATLVLTDSEHTRRDVINYLGVAPAKVRTVYPGITEAYVPPASEALAAFRSVRALPERFFLHVGTLQPRKNLERLITAFALFRQQTKLSHQLMLVGGKGWLYEGLATHAERQGVSTSVQFVGFVPAQEMPLWYAAAEACVFPSLYEGFGFPVVEAMACGTPVACSTASSLPEAAGDAALLFDPFAEEEIAAVLGRLATDAMLRTFLRERGRRQAERFSWRETARQVHAAYEAAG
ncbi:MAG: glycosyltransferase family 4 protein [Chloroflexi bacterium]|nr:glycosyltransferase family 4 protein [Chloroflexota bacterium]